MCLTHQHKCVQSRGEQCSSVWSENDSEARKLRRLKRVMIIAVNDDCAFRFKTGSVDGI